MDLFSAVFVELTEADLVAPGLAGREAFTTRVVEALGPLGDGVTVRSVDGCPWQVLDVPRATTAPEPPPLSPAWFQAQIDKREQRWHKRERIAERVSEALGTRVVVLEGHRSPTWVRFALWSTGERKRSFEFSGEAMERGGWVEQAGEPLPWEEDIDEIGPDLGSLANALGLPNTPGGRLQAPWSDAP